MNWQAEIFGNLTRIGSNPEYADMDNPRGEIVTEVSTSEAFKPVQPAYGSPAYIRENWELENSIIERNEAEIYG